MALADRLQEIMDAKGWSRAELGRQIGVSRARVTQMMQKGGISYDAAARLSRNSGFVTDWIRTGVGVKFRQKVVAGKSTPEIDLNLLKEAIGGIEIYLRDRKLSPPPEKKAQAIALVYEYYSSAGQADPAVVPRILRLVA